MITEVRLPKETPNDTSAVVVCWLVEDGQRVMAGDALVEVETSKVTMEIPAPAGGYVVSAVPPRHEAAVGDVLAYLCGERDELDDARARRGAPAAASGAADGDGQRFSPAALSYLAEHDISRERFAGLPVVTLDDVRRAAAAAEPPSPAKRLEIERLTRANVLNASLSVQFDGTAARDWAASAEVPSIRLLAAIVFATARSLTEYPELNAWFDGGLRGHEDIGVGIAVDLDDGLKVGVVHGAARLDVAGIERRIGRIISGYLNDTLTLADVTGGTVTVSDLSVEDVLMFQPLLNDRQGLAVGVGGDRALPGRPLTLTATFDHRLTTGRTVSRFLAACRRSLDELTGNAR